MGFKNQREDQKGRKTKKKIVKKKKREEKKKNCERIKKKKFLTIKIVLSEVISTREKSSSSTFSSVRVDSPLRWTSSTKTKTTCEWIYYIFENEKTDGDQIL